MEPFFSALLHISTRGLELAGIVSIVAGSVYATAIFLRHAFARDRYEAFRNLRSRLGRSILIGLEFLVAADIIATVAIEPNIENVLVLGGIILIRTFLSLSLEVEIDGKWPWQKSIQHHERHFAGKRETRRARADDAAGAEERQ